ncbi:MAG: undecaprenyl-diphosphate phosphatase [Alphaproteobacteria bacterium]|nr:undecaprenyl-diphosphate phosphatase [Alphaproteobacteria bacterium]
MPLFQLTVLALVQGITEFLPISSSGHLAALPHLMAWPDQGLAIDVAVHAGTLLAVLVYLRHEVAGMIAGLAGRSTPGLRLALLVILASVPVTVAGFLVLRHLGDVFRSIEVIAWTTLVFGILLGIADRSGAKSRRIEAMTWRDALLIGAAQVLALVPGTSRSGITMTAGLFLGYGRADAARFSLLLGIPAIAGAAVLTGFDLYRHGDAAIGLDAVIAGGLAFVSALLVIHLMMAWLARASFAPFVAYRVLLGLGLIGWIYL